MAAGSSSSSTSSISTFYDYSSDPFGLCRESPSPYKFNFNVTHSWFKKSLSGKLVCKYSIPLNPIRVRYDYLFCDQGRDGHYPFNVGPFNVDELFVLGPHGYMVRKNELYTGIEDRINSKFITTIIDLLDSNNDLCYALKKSHELILTIIKKSIIGDRERVFDNIHIIAGACDHVSLMAIFIWFYCHYLVWKTHPENPKCIDEIEDESILPHFCMYEGLGHDMLRLVHLGAKSINNHLIPQLMEHK